MFSSRACRTYFELRNMYWSLSIWGITKLSLNNHKFQACDKCWFKDCSGKYSNKSSSIILLDTLSVWKPYTTCGSFVFLITIFFLKWNFGYRYIYFHTQLDIKCTPVIAFKLSTFSGNWETPAPSPLNIASIKELMTLFAGLGTKTINPL